VRVPRWSASLHAGGIINPKTARSQFIGGMTMGVSMALLEETLLDTQLGTYVNHDLAMYHVAQMRHRGDRRDVDRRGGSAR